MIVKLYFYTVCNGGQQLLLDIDWKIPLTCHINCVGGIKECAPVSKSKQNVGILSISCVSGMLDRRHVHVQHVGGRCNHKECVGIRKII